MNVVPVGRDPTNIVCPSCQMQVTTTAKKKPTTKTHGIALAMCICLLWPCMCIPYCVASCNNIDHYCPNCQSYIGTYIN